MVGLSLLCGTPGLRAEDRSPAEKGTVRFTLRGDQEQIPERYRLAPHTFDYELALQRELPATGVDVFHLSFPSPVTSECVENNTVHAEYYRPRGVGPFPGVVILDITGGNQDLSRLIGRTLAQNRVAGLFVQMTYYGPRRPPGSKLRLLSPNVKHTLDAIRQTVLDVRRAAAWLESRPEIDAKRLGILGTSLGSMVGALCAEMEPRFGRVAILLGGGGLVDAFWDHPQAVPYRKAYEALGGKKEQVVKLIAPADPLTCAANLKDRKVLFIAGKRDEIVPPSATVRLWEASGKQKIVWYDCTHYGAALFFVPALGHILPHFTAP
jgi:dienelactone hydrolase